MLHQGLRRGEMLLLPANVIKSEYDHKQQRTRHWLSVRESKYAESDPDPRYSRPQIKTVHSRRQVPVSELTATLVQSYAENYRGRPKHSYLLNAQSNRPLSTESLTSAFKRISRFDATGCIERFEAAYRQGIYLATGSPAHLRRRPTSSIARKGRFDGRSPPKAPNLFWLVKELTNAAAVCPRGIRRSTGGYLEQCVRRSRHPTSLPFTRTLG